MVKNLPERICLQCGRPGFGIGKIPWRREWLSTPVFLLGEFHGQRSLAGYSPWGRKRSDTAERPTLRRISLVTATRIISYLLSQIIHYFSQFKKIHLMEYTYTGSFQFYFPKVVF